MKVCILELFYINIKVIHRGQIYIKNAHKLIYIYGDMSIFILCMLLMSKIYYKEGQNISNKFANVNKFNSKSVKNVKFATLYEIRHKGTPLKLTENKKKTCAKFVPGRHLSLYLQRFL